MKEIKNNKKKYSIWKIIFIIMFIYIIINRIYALFITQDTSGELVQEYNVMEENVYNSDL